MLCTSSWNKTFVTACRGLHALPAMAQICVEWPGTTSAFVFIWRDLGYRIMQAPAHLAQRSPGIADSTLNRSPTWPHHLPSQRLNVWLCFPGQGV
jgi:hypothetical protein